MHKEIPEKLLDCSQPDAFDWPHEVIYRQLGAPPLLTASDSFRESLIAENFNLSEWTGISPYLYEVNENETSAHSGHIFMNIAQMEHYFIGMSAAQLRCAMFFTLAHEYAHLLLRHRMGYRFMGRIHRFYEEASADIIAASWLSLKIGREEQVLPDFIRNTCLRLNSNSENYPSPIQRCVVAEKGMCLSTVIDNYCDPYLIGEKDYIPLFEKITHRDVSSLVRIAYQTIQEMRSEELYAQAIAAGRSRSRNSLRNLN